jgi:hypothetical protein
MWAPTINAVLTIPDVSAPPPPPPKKDGSVCNGATGCPFVVRAALPGTRGEVGPAWRVASLLRQNRRVLKVVYALLRVR